MTTVDMEQVDKSAVATQVVTRVVFFIAGLGMSAWAPLVPYAKARIQLSDASLGGLLLFLGAGSLLAMPLTGLLVGKQGCKRVILASGLVFVLMLPLLATLSTPLSLALALMLFGAAIGTFDVAMNIQAVEVEKAAQKTMMSGFHGFFSIGGIAGAGLVSLLLWLGCSPLQAVLALLVLIVALFIASHRHLLTERLHQADTPLFVLPHGKVLFLGLLCFILFLTEGAVLDWSALFLTQVRHFPAAQAGLAYAVFSVAMSIGRLTGDRVVNRFSRRLVMAGGCICAASGLLIAVTVNLPWLSLLAFLLVGFGAANTVPILFSATGQQSTMPVNLAISAMTTIGYAGILAGPALIGFVSHWSSLAAAFTAIALLLLAVAASARLVIR
ncbi:MFS transporter [Paramixta manurensis]|uniref:MFS transporter n=1 Tax=Paramixta manurensis TaxID=2740817 RepID=A0A6M8UDP8_9GAMM|nr:MFS transporter [Erwiniaceae bacterium PD-1]